MADEYGMNLGLDNAAARILYVIINGFSIVEKAEMIVLRRFGHLTRNLFERFYGAVAQSIILARSLARSLAIESKVGASSMSNS